MPRIKKELTIDNNIDLSFIKFDPIGFEIRIYDNTRDSLDIIEAYEKIENLNNYLSGITKAFLYNDPDIIDNLEPIIEQIIEKAKLSKSEIILNLKKFGYDIEIIFKPIYKRGI